MNIKILDLKKNTFTLLMVILISSIFISPVSAKQLNGVFTIQQKSTMRYLDAHETSGRDFRLVTRPRQNNKTQQWKIRPLGNNLFTIRQASNGRYVDAHEYAGKDFGLVTRPNQSNNTQRWIIKKVGNNLYTIQQKSNGRYVDAHEYAGKDFGLVTRPNQNNNTQRWIIKKVNIVKPSNKDIKNISFQIPKNMHKKLRVIQWELKASKVGRPILSGNRYQLVNLLNNRGIKRQVRSVAANLGWFKSAKKNYNMKIQRQRGNGQVHYGDRVALHMRPYGWLKYKKQKYGINLSDDDDNPHYIWIVTGGKTGKTLVSGMPFALYNTTERREMVYCKRTWGINLGWQGLPCKTWTTSPSDTIFGENGLFARDGLSGRGFTVLKNFLCDKGVKAGAAYAAVQTGGTAAVGIIAAVPYATKQCNRI